ncbi:hypothetical protein D3C72_889190 [compost metagenome]
MAWCGQVTYRSAVSEIPFICNYILWIYCREVKAHRAVGQGQDAICSRCITVLHNIYGITGQTAFTAGYKYGVGAGMVYRKQSCCCTGGPVIVPAVFPVRTCIQGSGCADTD